ncbi:MAG: thermonuclease family protein [Treponema sp.]|jgi:micrococcal nuclease|nr:thermonuclease family protein [Treponema sp.]
MIKPGRKNKITLLLIPLLLIPVAGLRLSQTAGTEAGGETAVYVTNSGSKYHRENCRSLQRSKIAVTLGDAVKSGYSPCSVCKPPALFGSGSGAAGADAADAAAQNGGELYRVNAAGLAHSAAADVSRMVRAEVVDHVDGDTVRVRIPNPPAGLGAVETIRLIGVDTPETVHPRRPVEAFGKEAGDFTKARLLNQPVHLAFDWDLRDRYGRLLAYIYTADGGCFNAELVGEGYGHAYTRFAFQFMDEFRSREQDARREQRGLWGNGLRRE